MTDKPTKKTEAIVLTKDEKEKIIKKIYENPKTGFGNDKDTYKQVQAVNKNITYKDIREFLSKQTYKQTQYVHKGYNSWIPNNKLTEIELDLIDMGQDKERIKRNKGNQYALVGIDNFTKIAHAVPMIGKKPTDIIPAFKEILDIIGVPKQMYSDNEGSFSSKEFIQLLNEKNIKHIVTHFAQGVERFNRTLKNMTILKLKAKDKEEQFKWSDALQDTLNKYNNQEHSTIKMTPNEAKKRGNHDAVYFNMWERAKRDRTYQELKVGDMVRTKEKKKLEVKITKINGVKKHIKLLTSKVMII